MSEFEDVLAALNRARVRFLLVGGLASVLHGVPRTTVDIDLALDPGKENVRRAVRALKRLGLSPDTEAVEDILGQGGVTASDEQTSVDLLTDIPGVRFADIWRRRTAFRYGRVRASVLSKADLVRILRSTGRRKDRENAAYLESHR